MREQHEKVVIFSVERTNLSKVENAKRTNDIKHLLSEFSTDFKLLEGWYKGTKETSFLVLEKECPSHRLIFNAYDQECYLLLDVDKEAFLVYRGGKKTSIGYFKETDKLIAQKQDSYTYDVETDKYYICQ